MQQIDPGIISACINRDTRAEYTLYRECYSSLMGICRRYVHNDDDAAELLNQGFLKILNNLKAYDETKPFDKWAKSILINTIIDDFRKNKKYKTTYTVSDELEASTSLHPVDVNTAESKISVNEMLTQIRRLPDGCREVFNLYVFEDMSHKQISETLSIPEGTSRWLLNNARVKLRKSFASFISTVKAMVL
jgi:RNA polymerase sigma factor (sigma-70 family)